MLNDSKYTQLSTIMKAMAYPKLLFILDYLSAEEHCVHDIQTQIAVDISTVSRHLAVLRKAGLIASRKVNNQIFYCLICPCIRDFCSALSR
jgi:ArsR family transcriptional regulator